MDVFEHAGWSILSIWNCENSNISESSPGIPVTGASGTDEPVSSGITDSSSGSTNPSATPVDTQMQTVTGSD